MSRGGGGVDRRDTRARNFLFGDRRSVEATLAAWSAWRERGPDGGLKRVVLLALRGEAANLLGTVAGLRAVEQLRGERFGFVLQVELPRGSGKQDELAAIGVSTRAAPATGIFVVVDPGTRGDRTAESRRVLEALRAHLEGPASASPVLILARSETSTGAAGASALRLGPRPGRVERIVCDLPAPLMDPLVEGVLAGMLADAPDDSPVVVTGVGARVAAVALGVGDLFIESAGAAHVLGNAQLAELARRVVVPPELTAWGAAPRTVADTLLALGAQITTLGAGAAKVSGLLVEPEVGPADPRSPFEVAHAGVV